MKIVVGVDGSEQATTALRWAVEEAQVHGADLEAVLAWSPFNQHHTDRSDPLDDQYDENDARSALDAWLAEDAEAPIAGAVVQDFPVPALLERGASADLIVVGSRGRGGFDGLLLGSVSERVAQLSDRPVVVVRTATPVRGGRVVVGFDGSPRSQEVVRWAGAEALAREATLDVVHAWRAPAMMSLSSAHAAFERAASEERAAREALDRMIDDPALAGVPTRTHIDTARPARALLDGAAGATLLVVSTRGLGRVAGALLGSVSRQVLHHASCPVAVI
jgi:nucleotide-binding universal stress UspA family protein